MKTLLSRFILGMMVVAVLAGCAGLKTTPLTDEQRFGSPNKPVI
jgi:hypothetical protein